MEIPRKYNDCYFYYYSTCAKGDSCAFRHEPMALGCEQMCPLWQQGKCVEKRCKLRHMELRKNRKQIPCYWENQPGGCRKKHCPFMHKNPQACTDGIAPSQPGHSHQVVMGQVPMPEHVGNSEPHQMAGPPLWPPQRQVVLDAPLLLPGGEMLPARAPPGPYAAMPVDQLVLNFDDESDNECGPSSSGSPGQGKSRELLRLDQIQAEAAAYYSYSDMPDRNTKTLATKYERTSTDDLTKTPEFKIMSLDEIRSKRKTESIIQGTPINLNLSRKRKLSTHESITSSGKVLKVVRSNSVIYRKLDDGAQNQFFSSSMTDILSRKRTYSEQSDTLDLHEDAESMQFKKVKIPSYDSLVRNISVSDASDVDLKDLNDLSKTDESDSEIQIVSVENVNNNNEVIELDSHVEDSVIDLSDVPDVVASCVSSQADETELNKSLDDIDNLLADETL